MMKCIVGLGNFPEKYASTRHNFGFLAVEKLAQKFDFPAFRLEKKFFSQISEGEISGEKVILCKPETYMNLSGKAVLAILNFYKLKPADIFVFCDDLDLDFGKIRFREKGSAGGHNGLKSLIFVLGTQEFLRIKFGISNPDRDKIPTEKFVLMNFSKEEQARVPGILEEGIEKFLQNFSETREEGTGNSKNESNFVSKIKNFFKN